MAVRKTARASRDAKARKAPAGRAARSPAEASKRQAPAVPPRRQPPELRPLSAYERRKERSRRIQADMARSGRDIGPLPRVRSYSRRKSCERNLEKFLRVYFPQSFPLPFSPDHRKAIKRIETAVLHGGLFALAMPRGDGKSTICERAAIWALAYGHRRFVVLISAEASLSTESLDSIVSELENNELLGADFPEACYPIRCLEGIHQRAAGQLYRGRRTEISLTDYELVLPTVPGSRCSGGIIRTAGITGRIRGMKATKPDGANIRPDLVLVDDPQTDESAHSPAQCAQRERIMKGAVLGLAGPGSRIAGLAAVTVVCPDDLADRLLDRDKHPEWKGERCRMVTSWPKAEARWTEYIELRRRTQREQEDISPEGLARVCNAFYRAHREEMDAGAAVAWPERKEHDDLSAIQHAYNLRADRGDAAFFAEYQNEPLIEEKAFAEIRPDAIAAKLSGHARGEVPLTCTHLTAFIDVHEKALYWLVAGWEAGFGGYVIDYGTEPDQKTGHFALATIRRTLKLAATGTGLEAAIYAGLERLGAAVLGREWLRGDGSGMRIERAMIDANWGEQTDLVYKFCRQSRWAGVLLPSHGKYIGAGSRPMSEWQTKPGDRLGTNWRIPAASGRRALRHVLFDSNYWKSFVRARLVTAMGDAGCLALFGRAAGVHGLLAEHLTSEYRVQTEGRGRKVDEWKQRGGQDNHWLDCLVGAAVAASICGARILGGPEPALRRRRVRLSELQRARRG